jgi:hypothetical protein
MWQDSLDVARSTPSPPPTQGNTTQNNAGIIRLETRFEVAILVSEPSNKLGGNMNILRHLFVRHEQNGGSKDTRICLACCMKLKNKLTYFLKTVKGKVVPVTNELSTTP